MVFQTIIFLRIFQKYNSCCCVVEKLYTFSFNNKRFLHFDHLRKTVSSYDFCFLFSCFLKFLDIAYSKQYGSIYGCSQGSNLISVHSVCFGDLTSLNFHLNTCSRCKSLMVYRTTNFVEYGLTLKHTSAINSFDIKQCVCL